MPSNGRAGSACVGVSTTGAQPVRRWSGWPAAVRTGNEPPGMQHRPWSERLTAVAAWAVRRDARAQYRLPRHNRLRASRRRAAQPRRRLRPDKDPKHQQSIGVTGRQFQRCLVQADRVSRPPGLPRFRGQGEQAFRLAAPAGGCRATPPAMLPSVRPSMAVPCSIWNALTSPACAGPSCRRSRRCSGRSTSTGAALQRSEMDRSDPAGICGAFCCACLCAASSAAFCCANRCVASSTALCCANRWAASSAALCCANLCVASSAAFCCANLWAASSAALCCANLCAASSAASAAPALRRFVRNPLLRQPLRRFLRSPLLRRPLCCFLRCLLLRTFVYRAGFACRLIRCPGSDHRLIGDWSGLVLGLKWLAAIQTR